MSGLAWFLLGLATYFAAGLAIACMVEREVRDGLVRVVIGPLVLPFLVVAAWSLRLPKVTRRRVTAGSLRAALDDDRYENRTDAINWPGGALVLLRSKGREQGDDTPTTSA